MRQVTDGSFVVTHCSSILYQEASAKVRTSLACIKYEFGGLCLCLLGFLV